jgi:hypothetical protein
MHAIVNDAAEIFTLINTFTVLPQRQDAVIRSLRDFTEQHARVLPGFIGASVHASLDGHFVVNYVQWASKSNLVAMTASAEARAHIAEVGSIADHVNPLAYRVAFVGSREHARP